MLNLIFFFYNLSPSAGIFYHFRIKNSPFIYFLIYIDNIKIIDYIVTMIGKLR